MSRPFPPVPHIVRAAAAALAVASCAEPPLIPSQVEERYETVATEAVAGRNAIRPWESNAAIDWNEVARQRVIANRSPAAFAIRGYAVVAVAQYQAAIAAEQGRVRNDQPSVHAAIAAASVAALSYLYPADGPALEALLIDYLAGPSRPEDRRTNVVTGIAIGRAAADEVIAHAQTDNFFAQGTVDVPVGPGLWFSSRPPAGPLLGKAKTWFLLSGDQFRPPPPPAFGSPGFLAALAEVRAISDSRTAEQAANALFWDGPPGTYTPPGIWNEIAATLARGYRLGERKAAHLFALINMVSFDALVASHEAKYQYWFIRPSQADPLITTSILLPNHPSYPSNHGAISGGMAHILAHEFPAERNRMEALAEEAAFSRVLGGIHYRFDGEAGLTLGRAVADWAIANDVRGHEPFDLP